MSINSKVLKSNHSFQDEEMLQGIKTCANRGFMLEPYTSSLQLICNFTSAKPASNRQNLPRLPVPKLDDTLNKYLKTVRPFLSDEEFAATSTLVKDFGSDRGVGRKLQGLLEKRAEKHHNWLEEWWLNTAYLEYRDPVVVFSSPGLVFPFRKFDSQHDQLKYAAKTLLAALDYKALIDGDKIPVEMMGNSPLDMTQYKKIFGTCRIPWEKRDKLSFNNSTHVTVMHNKHMFHLDLWGDDNKRLSEDQIIEALKKVIQLSVKPNKHGVGILTSENRDTWAKAYQLLSKDASNASALRSAESSVAVLCLDGAAGLWGRAEAERRSLAAAHTIHGAGSAANGANRWFDKTVQFIVGADGITGLTYEHSPAEGQPIAVLTDFIINYIDQNKSSSVATSTRPKDPVRLDFTVSSEVAGMIETAEVNLDRLVADLELNCFKFERFGKNFIKAHKMSPDSFLQMAMQYAFYRLHKTPGAHYESAATRMYVGGRTETIRSCSVESIEFAKAMLDSQSSHKAKLLSMQNAIKAHKDYTVQALQGYGVDRHLLGLKLIALENGIEIPKLYQDQGYVRSAHMRISTSQVACKCDGFMCYGPLVADGYATCYNPRDDDVNFATSAFVRHPDTSCEAYRTALERSLQDMHDVLLQNSQSKL